ncbi:MAG: hypothetical protein ACRC7G_12410 [Beijerinckiaceae bacterium]
MADPQPPVLSDTARKRQRARSVAIAFGLVALIALFYLITIFKMGASVLNRSM